MPACRVPAARALSPTPPLRRCGLYKTCEPKKCGKKKWCQNLNPVVYEIERPKSAVFTTKSELLAALEDDTSDIENWDVSLIDDFSNLVSFATPRAWPSLARSCRRAAPRGRAPRARTLRPAARRPPAPLAHRRARARRVAVRGFLSGCDRVVRVLLVQRRPLQVGRGQGDELQSDGASRPRGGVASKQLARAASGAASLAHRRARARRIAVLPRGDLQRRPLQVGCGEGDGL